MMQCNICKEFFNPAMLSEVFEHEHKGISTDKENYGKKVIEGCGNCEKKIGCKIDNNRICFNYKKDENYNDE